MSRRHAGLPYPVGSQDPNDRGFLSFFLRSGFDLLSNLLTKDGKKKKRETQIRRERERVGELDDARLRLCNDRMQQLKPPPSLSLARYSIPPSALLSFFSRLRVASFYPHHEPHPASRNGIRNDKKNVLWHHQPFSPSWIFLTPSRPVFISSGH